MLARSQISSRACASIRGPEQLLNAEVAENCKRTAEDCKRELQERTTRENYKRELQERTTRENCKRELQRGDRKKRTASVRKREAGIGGMTRDCRVHNHSADIADDPDLGDTIGASRRHQPTSRRDNPARSSAVLLQFSCSSLAVLLQFSAVQKLFYRSQRSFASLRMTGDSLVAQQSVSAARTTGRAQPHNSSRRPSRPCAAVRA